MAQLSRPDFLNKWKEIIGTEKEIDFLEDMADSFPESVEAEKNEENNNQPDYENDENPYKAKFNEMRQKYVDRFLGGKPTQDDGGAQNVPSEKNEQDYTTPNGTKIDADIFETK